MTQFLCCPCDKKSELCLQQDGAIFCKDQDCVHAKDGHSFTSIGTVPILISFENCDTVCDPAQYESINENLFYTVSRRSTFIGGIARALTSGTSVTTVRNCHKFVELLNGRSSHPKVLVIGSGTRGSGTDALWLDTMIAKTGIDIYPSKTTDYVADAHYLPFVDGAFDGVWIQAVLEHVANPQLVVKEIHRVLADSGIVYAETPFMQQVHEGAYDYQRFTVLGHRYLFRSFDTLDIGGNKGPGVALSWSIRYFLWGLTRSRSLARILSAPFAIILKLFDRLIDDRALWDSSSGVYFLGRRADQALMQADLPKAYRGFQK